MQKTEKPIMDPAVAEIVKRLAVVVDDEQWQAIWISYDRFEKDGPQWVHLEIEKDGKPCVYYIDRKRMVKAWLALDAGRVEIDGMSTFMNGIKWTPINAGDVMVRDIRSIQLTLRSPEGKVSRIAIDRQGLIDAYHALLKNMQDFINDGIDVIKSMIELS